MVGWLWMPCYLLHCALAETWKHKKNPWVRTRAVHLDLFHGALEYSWQLDQESIKIKCCSFLIFDVGVPASTPCARPQEHPPGPTGDLEHDLDDFLVLGKNLKEHVKNSIRTTSNKKLTCNIDRYTDINGLSELRLCAWTWKPPLKDAKPAK